jgi:hypothetical protein
MLVQYWMDSSSWTNLRTRLMFANVPMCIFFGFILLGQAKHNYGMDCPTMAIVLQVTYLTMNLWQTMTIVTAYRFIILGRGRYKGHQQLIIHLVCWGLPLCITGGMWFIDRDVFHSNIFKEPSMGYGIGWCGVRSDRRVLKGLFVNTPQLVCVSFYAQFYSYIHQKIDPPEDLDPLNRKTQVSMSKNAALMGATQRRHALYEQSLAAELRSYMTAYMLSFLTNTVLQVVGDNMAIGPPKDWNLMLQAAVVTPQGFLIALVYKQTAPNNLATSYLNVLIEWCARRGKSQAASNLKAFRDSNAISGKLKGMDGDCAKCTRTRAKCLGGLSVGEWTAVGLLMPVGIWVWAPMEFLSELLNRQWTFVGLVVFGIFTVFPFYWFRQEQDVGMENGLRTDLNPAFFSWAAQAYFIAVVLITIVAVFQAKYAYHLNMIEGAVRRKGLFASIGEGIRMNSVRNAMSTFTAGLEFYQIWGLAWNTARMTDRYDMDSTSDNADGSASLSGDLNSINNAIYWLSVLMVLGWALLYALPSVITTVTVANRQVAHSLSESYRKYLWFMSGAGFLTLLKALLKFLFCIEDPLGRTVTLTAQSASTPMMVPMGDYSMQCWDATHLRYCAISCVCLVIFFPSASLTCLFRYDDEDNRGCGRKHENGQLVAAGYFPCHGGCVLGGEDIRWIHIWRRVEYLVKAIWVFSSFKFSGYGTHKDLNPGIIFLLIGSFQIALMNAYMHPCNLSYFGRMKLLIHMCNVWTTITCVWVIGQDVTNKAIHLLVMFGGWLAIWGCILSYEGYKYKTDTFRQPAGDKKNIAKCLEEIKLVRNKIYNAKGLAKWGVHRHITRVTRFAEHHEDVVRKSALEVIAWLAYQDQMTSGTMQMGTSRFIFLTPVNPMAETLMMTIEGTNRNDEPIEDPETRNLATRAMLTYLQSNVWNKAFGIKSFYQAIADYDQTRVAETGKGAVEVFVEYIAECKDRTHQINAMILLLNFCKVDSNHLVKVCDVALPLLKLRMESGHMIEQYVALQITLMIADRFDLTQQLIDSGIVSTVINLFHAVMLQYQRKQFAEGGVDCFASSKGHKQPEPLTVEFVIPGHALPVTLKKLFVKGSARVAGAPPSVQVDITLKEKHLLTMMHYMMANAMQVCVDTAAGVSAAGRRHLIEIGALQAMMKCFDFVREHTDADESVASSLRPLALQAAHAFLCGPFGDRDIDVDPDFKVYHGMIGRFKQQVGEGAVEPVLEFDTTLTPAQRRKAHIICAFNKLSHLSVGVGLKRHVVATWDDAPVQKERGTNETKMMNPMLSLPRGDSNDEDLGEELMGGKDTKQGVLTARGAGNSDPSSVQAHAVVKRPSFYQHSAEKNFQSNYQAVNRLGLYSHLIELEEACGETSKVMFHIVDIMLLLLEHGMVTKSERKHVRSVMCKVISSDNVGMAVMGAVGMDMFVTQDKLCADFGARRGKYLDGKHGHPLKMFRWAGRMVYWIKFWNIHSGSMGMLTPEEELYNQEKKEQERAKEVKAQSKLKAAERYQVRLEAATAHLQAEREAQELEGGDVEEN